MLCQPTQGVPTFPTVQLLCGGVWSSVLDGSQPRLGCRLLFRRHVYCQTTFMLLRRGPYSWHQGFQLGRSRRQALLVWTPNRAAWAGGVVVRRQQRATTVAVVPRLWKQTPRVESGEWAQHSSRGGSKYFQGVVAGAILSLLSRRKQQMIPEQGGCGVCRGYCGWYLCMYGTFFGVCRVGVARLARLICYEAFLRLAAWAIQTVGS